MGVRQQATGGEPEPAYEGIPLSQIRIDDVDWFYRADHIRTRSQRQGNDFDVEPEWATEAALDKRRIVSLTYKPTGEVGKSLEVLGLSPSAPGRSPGTQGRVLKVWIVPKDLANGSWWGSSACDANDKDRQAFKEKNP